MPRQFSLIISLWRTHVERPNPTRGSSCEFSPVYVQAPKTFFSDGKWSIFFLRWDYFATPCSEHDLVIDLIISFLEKPLYTFPSQFAGGENARKK